MKSFLISLLVVGSVIVVYSDGYSQTLGSPKPYGKPPLITNFYGPEQMKNGDALKFYIAAEDPDADMLGIAVTASVVYGGGESVTRWIYLKPGNEKTFKGYLQWNTRSWSLRDFTKITLEVSVFDVAGNDSNEVVMPMTVSNFHVSYPPVPPPFGQEDIKRLGYIHMNLRDPLQDTPSLF